MLGEKDVSILGRLKDKISNSSFAQFKSYMNEKLEYVNGKIGPVKTRILGTDKTLKEDLDR